MDRRGVVRQRLADEVGTLYKDAPERVALVYPSPYRVGMSSLGFQTIYREINAHPGRAAERAFLPDDPAAERGAGGTLCTYESGLPVSSFPVGTTFGMAWSPSTAISSSLPGLAPLSMP